MLYERWQRIAREQSREIALIDLSTDRRWTFAELAAEADGKHTTASEVQFPQGNGADFVVAVLAAWRAGAVVCPLESGQTMPPMAELPAEIAHLKTTSATTGAARLVAFTPEQLAADADNIVQTMGLRPDWPNLGVISLAHSYGFSNLVTPLLLHGIPLVLVNSPLPETVRRGASAVAHATLPGVPTMWRAWHEADSIPANVRLAISAGAPLPLALEQAVFQKHALKLHNFYGATECGGIAYDCSTEPRSEGSCAGSALKNVELTVNAGGCLEVRGKAVGQCYWPEPEGNLGAGCYRTSDLVEVKAGAVFLRGRASDQINVAGRKISPEAIERVLQTHPEVSECLVFGAPAPGTERSEIIVACVAAGNGTDGEVLKQFLLTRLPAWQIPREWRFVESLSPNQRGKLSRAEWRRRLGFATPA
jgi:acyl-CoA synthetase (AMP-forming)/AMP-acid ligase II